jgi:hypothetical protein
MENEKHAGLAQNPIKIMQTFLFIYFFFLVRVGGGWVGGGWKQ